MKDDAPAPMQYRVRFSAWHGDTRAYRYIEHFGLRDEAWAACEAEVRALGPEWRVVFLSEERLEPSHSSGVTVLVS